VVFPVRNLLLHRDHLHQAEHQLYAHPSSRPYEEVHLQPLCVLYYFHRIKSDRTVLYHLPVQAGVVCRLASTSSMKQTVADFLRFAWDTSTEGGSCNPAHILADIYYADTAVNIITDWFCALLYEQSCHTQHTSG
jgi:hypothetical protein